jgi:hypothetical protein
MQLEGKRTGRTKCEAKTLETKGSPKSKNLLSRVTDASQEKDQVLEQVPATSRSKARWHLENVQ